MDRSLARWSIAAVILISITDVATGQGQAPVGSDGAAPVTSGRKSTDGPQAGSVAGPAAPLPKSESKTGPDSPVKPASVPAPKRAVVKAPPADTTTPPPKASAPKAPAPAATSGFVTRARCAELVRKKYTVVFGAHNWQSKIDLCVSSGGQSF